MPSPWSGLDAAAGKNLHLDPTAGPALGQACEPYTTSLQNSINDRLDDTTRCFGTNPLAVLLEQAFNSRGTQLTNYCEQQLSQTLDCVKTAQDAAGALMAADSLPGPGFGRDFLIS